MKRKRILCFAVLAVLLSLAVGGAVAEQPPQMKTITQKGKIAIGLNADYPPFCLWHNGQPRGFDVELARAIAAKMGLDPQRDVTFTPVRATDFIDALESGKIDLAVAGITITSERSKRVAFTRPYYTATLAALLARAKVPQIQVENVVRPMPLSSVTDLKKIEPLVVAVKEQTTIQIKSQRLLRHSKIVGFPDMRSATEAVVEGHADALIHEDPYLRHLKAGELGRVGRFVALTKPVTKERLAVACRPGDPDFLRWLNVAIDELDDAGLLAAWEERYFDHVDWRKEVPWK